MFLKSMAGDILQVDVPPYDPMFASNIVRQLREVVAREHGVNASQVKLTRIAYPSFQLMMLQPGETILVHIEDEFVPMKSEETDDEFMHIVNRGDISAFQHWMAYHPDPNFVFAPHHNFTPLMLACQYAQPEIALALVQNGANASPMDNDNVTSSPFLAIFAHTEAHAFGNVVRAILHAQPSLLPYAKEVLETYGKHMLPAEWYYEWNAFLTQLQHQEMDELSRHMNQLNLQFGRRRKSPKRSKPSKKSPKRRSVGKKKKSSSKVSKAEKKSPKASKASKASKPVKRSVRRKVAAVKSVRRSRK